jgi:flavin reductase (DIM6/NTAB) family NADH-FMN oxidoreductase RutF
VGGKRREDYIMDRKVEVPIEHGTRFIIAPLLDSLVTCVGKDGKPNIIEISLLSKSWGLPCKKSDPPFGVFQIMVHPARYSHKLIEESGEFVINIPTPDIVEQSLFCGTRSGRDVDKFKETKLTPVPAKHVKAPLIEECVVNIECEVVETMKPKHSVYTFFFGKALAIHAEEGMWDGSMVNLDKFPMALPVLHTKTLQTEYRLLGKDVRRGK